MQQRRPDPDKLTCPYTGHKKLCRTLREHCPKWVMLTGKHPQDEGQVVEEWACADSWEPVLLVEIAQRVEAQGDAIQLLRKEVVRGQEEAMKLMNPLWTVGPDGAARLSMSHQVRIPHDGHPSSRDTRDRRPPG